MCLMGSITSENRGGGSDPLRKNSITNPFFFWFNASLKGMISADQCLCDNDELARQAVQCTVN